MKQESAKIIHMNPLPNGIWMHPSQACRYFKNGRGINEKTLMNKIYAGKLGRYAKYTPQGWIVLVVFEVIEQYQPLKAA